MTPIDMETYSALEVGALVTGKVIPANTVLSAKIYGMPSKTPHPSSTISVLVYGQLLNPDRPLNDYKSSTTDPTERFEIKIVFTGNTSLEQVEVDRERLRSQVTRRVQLDVSGMKVVELVPGDGKKRKATLEAHGPRAIKLENGQLMIILEDDEVEDPKDTPEWYPTPPDPPTEQVDTEPSRFLPITTLPIPIVPRFAQAGPSRRPTVNQPMSKRSASPEKQFTAAKRARVEADGRASSPFPKHNGFVTQANKSSFPKQVEESETVPVAEEEEEAQNRAVDTRMEEGGSGDPVETDEYGDTPDLMRHEEPLDSIVPATSVAARQSPGRDVTPVQSDVNIKVESVQSSRAAVGGRTQASDRVRPGIDNDSINTRARPPVSPQRRSRLTPYVEIPERRRTRSPSAPASPVRTPSSMKQSPSPTPIKPVIVKPQVISSRQAGATSKMEHMSPAIPARQAESSISHGPPQVSAQQARVAEAMRRRQEIIEVERAIREEEEQQAQTDMLELQQSGTVSGYLYQPLDSIQSGQLGNVMGIVVTPSSKPDSPTMKAKDWRLNIVLGDPSTHAGGPGSEGVVITIFRRQHGDLPYIIPGQAILLRGLRFNTYNMKVKGNMYSGDAQSWGILDKNGNTRTSPGGTISAEEKNRLQALQRWWNGLTGGQNHVGYIDDHQQSDSASPCQDKAAFLKDVVPSHFYDLTVKILHVQHNLGRGARYELYVTDGTAHAEIPHNFHNIDNGTTPSAVFSIGIFDEKPDHVASMFVAGNYIVIRNVMVKRHTKSHLLELKWAEKVNTEQKEQGWKEKSCTLLLPTDYRATEINRRVNELKRGGTGNNVNDARRSASAAPPRMPSHVRAAPVGQPVRTSTTDVSALVPLASHISTVYTDPTYPVSTLVELRENRMFPNKFRIRARVKAVYPRLPNPVSYVTAYCKDCNRSFMTKTNLCQSCGKPEADIELRYRLIVLLQQDEEEMPILIDGPDAEDFLPPLPPIRYSDNPNDTDKQKVAVKENCAKVEEVLMGAKMDGERTRPVIDWTLEVYEVPWKDKVGKKVVAVRAFGMRKT